MENSRSFTAASTGFRSPPMIYARRQQPIQRTKPHTKQKSPHKNNPVSSAAREQQNLAQKKEKKTFVSPSPSVCFCCSFALGICVASLYALFFLSFLPPPDAQPFRVSTHLFFRPKNTFPGGQCRRLSCYPLPCWKTNCSLYRP